MVVSEYLQFKNKSDVNNLSIKKFSFFSDSKVLAAFWFLIIFVTDYNTIGYRIIRIQPIAVKKVMSLPIQPEKQCPTPV
jgi:hypothetical protein